MSKELQDAKNEVAKALNKLDILREDLQKVIVNVEVIGERLREVDDG